MVEKDVTRNDGKTSLTLKSGNRFREKPIHPGPMAMGPNTIEGDSHRQKHESMQRLQSVTRGG